MFKLSVEQNEALELLKQYPLKPFQPYAWYDQRLQRITYLNRDCSYTEFSLSPGVIVLIDNYPEPNEQRFCGFVLDGINLTVTELACLLSADRNWPRAQTIAIKRLSDLFFQEITTNKIFITSI